jgi:hypothetical protein
VEGDDDFVRVLCEYDNVGGMQVADSVRRHSSNKIRREVIGPGTSYVFRRELLRLANCN